VGDDQRRPNGESKRDLDEAIRDLADEDRRSLSGHPDPVTLLDFHEGKLSATAADRVEEHLALCAECARTVLDFAEFPHLEPPDEEYRMTPAEVERQRRAVEERLGVGAPSSFLRPAVLLPLAATFLVAAVALGIWGAGLQRRVAELEGPRGDVYLLGGLRAEDSLLRGGEEHTIPEWAERVMLYLTLPGGEEKHLRYEVDAVSDGGVPVLRGVRVEPDDDGTLALEIDAGSLPPGKYRFELFGVDGGERTSLSGFPIQIVEAE
jgi:anti-sigma factor RsiW